jgi:uncharacterized protein (TIGR02246 family)
MVYVARWTAIAILTVLANVPAAAQRPRTAEEEVLATDDERMDALRRGDPIPLRKIYADDYSLVTGTGQVRTKADQLAELTSGQLRYPQIEPAARHVRLYGDVAIVLTTQKAIIIQAGRRVTGPDEMVTRVYKNFDGQWRVIATHATPIRSAP